MKEITTLSMDEGSLKEISTLSKEEVQRTIEALNQRLNEIKNEEAMQKIKNVRPGSYVSTNKGRKSEKIGVVKLMGEDFIIIQLLNDTRKFRLSFFQIDDVFSSKVEAEEREKSVKEEKKEEPTIVPEPAKVVKPEPVLKKRFRG